MALDRAPITAADMELDDRDGPPKKTPQQVADYYLDAVQSAEKRRKPYITRGKQIVKRFKNKRTLTTLGVPLADRRMPTLGTSPVRDGVSERSLSRGERAYVASWCSSSG